MFMYIFNRALTILLLSIIPIQPKLQFLRKSAPDSLDEEQLKKFLQVEYEQQESKLCNNQASKEWEHMVDIDDTGKSRASIKATLESAKLDKMYWKKYFSKLDPSNFKDINLKRQIAKLSRLGNSALGDAELTKFTAVTNKMTEIYSTAKICPFGKTGCCLDEDGLLLEPDLVNIMAKSDNYAELEYIWKAWRDVSGSHMKELFYDYVLLSNKAAKANGFADKGALWRSDYESEDFEGDMQRLWEQVKPLYDELHQYVLNKLTLKYGDNITNDDGLIPAHLLGNMWAQDWLNIGPLVVPFPEEPQIDVTELLKENEYTVLKMFEIADEFYKSLGLEPNGVCYNVSRGAMIEKPEDGRNVVCHASAWDFCNGKDFRIKMCAEVDFENFIIVHHEMGHIQYYQLYKDQPYAFRTGANPGFHEAIGDTIALSVSMPDHLYRIGLLSELRTSRAASINSLMNMALERVAFLPFGYLIDKWRWDVFRGDVSYSNWNEIWWKYRETIQKVRAPVERSDEEDFDPGAKFHVASDSQYISYFFAHILEFQLHRGLCIAAGQYNPKNPKKKQLHMCDIYKSKAAGKRLRDGLSLGSSVHWREVLKTITGETMLSGRALMEYFQPLLDFLIDINIKTASSE